MYIQNSIYSSKICVHLSVRLGFSYFTKIENFFVKNTINKGKSELKKFSGSNE